jgi:hypothetical protein
VADAGGCGGLTAAVQPPFEPGGSAVRLCSEYLAAGEGVLDAPTTLQERGGAEGGGGRGYGEAQGRAGARGVAKSMLGQLPSDLRQTLLVGVT